MQACSVGVRAARLGAALALVAGVASALPSGPKGPSYVLVARPDDKEVRGADVAGSATAPAGGTCGE